MKRINLVGRKFGRWTVICGVIGASERRTDLHWLCECSCKQKTRAVLRGNSLRSENSTSCGCVRREVARAIGRTAGTNAAKKRAGANYISRDDFWYRLCSGRMHVAKKRNISFGFLSVHEFATYCKSIAPQTCPVFNMPLEVAKKRMSSWSYSIDRIDPKLGYVRGNIQIISWKANALKGNATLDELTAFAKWVLF
jgi:hypothetical protein